MKISFNLKKTRAKMGFGEMEGWVDCLICRKRKGEIDEACSCCGEKFEDKQVIYHEEKGCHLCEDCVELLKMVSSGEGI